MKHLKALALIAALSISTSSFAQKIKLIEGNIPADLKKEKSVNIEFSYENMSVGKFDKEQDYIAAKSLDCYSNGNRNILLVGTKIIC